MLADTIENFTHLTRAEFIHFTHFTRAEFIHFTHLTHAEFIHLTHRTLHAESKHFTHSASNMLILHIILLGPCTWT